MATANNLPKIPAISQLSARVIRVLGANPGAFTLQGTNSYLIGRDKERFLLDTTNPNKPEYIESLRHVMKEKGIVISNVLITHWHEDHIGAIPEVQALCLEVHNRVPLVHKFPGGPIPSWAQDVDGKKTFEKIEVLKDNQVFQVDADTTLRILHTPGHTSDHVSVCLEEERLLFAGDMILGHGTAVFEALHDYMGSLQRVLDLSPPWSKILSAHGMEITTPDEFIKTYISHRKLRISQVFDSLSDDEWLSDEQLVEKVYPGLEANLKFGALNNLRQALGYLLQTKNAITDGENRWKSCSRHGML